MEVKDMKALRQQLKESQEKGSMYRQVLAQLWQSLQWQHDHSPSVSGCMVCAAHDATRKALAGTRWEAEVGAAVAKRLEGMNNDPQ